MNRRLLRSPFFYSGLGALFLVVPFVLASVGPSKHPSFPNSSPKIDIFDENQYLFPEPNSQAVFVGLSIAGNTVLEPIAPPFLVSGKTLASFIGDEPRREIEEYTAQEGDTLSLIAQKFGISLETLLWANNLSKNARLEKGKKLIILPVSGVLHIVRKGDTISEIAEFYKVKTEDIMEFNELDEAGRITVGDFLIIPGAKKPKIVQDYVQAPLSRSYFICPIPSPCRITQGLHWFNAVDFSNGRCGEPVFAAAGGQVQTIGYGNVSGYFVKILHPNNVVTFYGHLAKIAVQSGEPVYQGQIVGYTGHTGLTVPKGPEGCHLHFDVRFAQNPFAKFEVGAQLGK